MKTNKYCEGCSIRKIIYSPCWMENKNKDGDCPCSECIVKPSCNITCDNFFKWKEKFLYITRQKGKNIEGLIDDC